MRPPPHLVRPPRQGKAPPPAQGSGGDFDGHRQGHPHHPHHGGGDGSRPQPDDRLWHRRSAGRLCGRDQAAPPQPGIYPQAHRRDRAAGSRHRRFERHPRKACPHPQDHHEGIGRRGKEVRPAPPQRDPLRPARGRGRRRGRSRAGLSRHCVLHPRGLSEEDPAPEPAHCRCAQAQGGRRDRPAGGDAEQRRSAVLHRQTAGV